MREKLQNPDGGSIAILLSMLMVSLGAWGIEHVNHGDTTWCALLSPEHIFSVLANIDSAVVPVVGAWLSKSPLK